ncbi:MAG: hydantoinase/oxoprolinase family protein [Deltaproteobacteria bacterium]|nr:hydantoinase/oxoprolinase family protein [Deltaproteobacteria bacterium]
MIIGLDVGGTHTDAVLVGKDGILRSAKVTTNPDRLFESVWGALEEVLGDMAPERMVRVVLSTTLTTNAIAEGKLQRAGMIVSSGPGVDPEFYRTGPDYFTVSGSIDHRGREVQPVDRLEIEAISSRLHSQGIRCIGVVGKFSVRNPAHELQICELLDHSFDYVVPGHRLSGNLSFPRRIATAYLNASVYTVHRQFFEAVRESLKIKGLVVPIYVLKADGGTMSLETSLANPGQSILSGPAASVMGSLPFASREEETLVLDIGGTTTDMAVLIRGTPLLDPLGIEIGGYKTLIRSLKTRSIGLGGDSCVRVVQGKLTLGPDRKGPAMAHGGPAPTPTDALFVLGKIQDGNVDAAKAGIESIAQALGVSPLEAARRIFDQACESILETAARMIGEINDKPVYTVHEVLEGHTVKPTEILVLGGPAPHFAQRLVTLTDFRVRIVPNWQVANAAGAALARPTSEVTLFVDTERGIALAPEEGFSQSVKRDFGMDAARELALRLLQRKHRREGSCDVEPEMEVIEQSQFNMVRQFHTSGRNIRVKVQVKPGILTDYGGFSQRG